MSLSTMLMFDAKDLLTDALVMFFILPILTRANPSMYLGILFYQPGKKIGNFLPDW